MGIDEFYWERFEAQNYMENTTGNCFICHHKYESLDEFILRQPVYMGRYKEKFLVGCKDCYQSQLDY